MYRYTLGFSYLGIILMVILIIRTIYGLVASHIATKRGMKGEGFWWGFFLGAVGIIVMRCCPRY